MTRDVLAAIVFAVAAALIVCLIIVVVVSCAPAPPRSGVRALDAPPGALLLGAEWHERDLAIAYAQPTPGCYGKGPVWCACPFICGAGWRQDPSHFVWRHTAAECNCT